MTADWFYIGHYGQLGPLTFDDMQDLVQGGVIARDTYVWREGMTDWVPAERMPDLQQIFALTAQPSVPPPPPMPKAPPAPEPRPMMPVASVLAADPHYYPSRTSYGVIRSDRSRALGGVLQLFPGFGRMYLGYWAHGVLQLVFTLCGFGILWSWIDGLYILAGGVKLDGYGRRLPE